MMNHKRCCRLCLTEFVDDHSKFLITDGTSTTIFNLNLKVSFVSFHFGFTVFSFLEQVILTNGYSSFICMDCHQSLQQFSSFRTTIFEKQSQLAKYLCRIENNEIFELKPVKLEVNVNPLPVECVVVKTEWIDEDDVERWEIT